MTVFERIKETSKERGLNLQKVATDAHLGINAIYRWKTQTPTADSLKAVAEVLNVSVDYLLGNTNEKSPSSTKSTSNRSELDLSKVANDESWDEYLSTNGRPLSNQDKAILRALFGDYSEN